MIVGVDFGAPKRARDQRKKIIAIAAHRTDWHAYRVDATGFNSRLLTSDPPGWTARELLGELLDRPARIVGFDFPFSIPHALLSDAAFAAAVGHTERAFGTWRTFNAFVAKQLPITDLLDFTPLSPWRARADRATLWTKRATDIEAGGQPPLKDLFQATFQMTLLGNVLLSKLWESGQYRVLPFPGGGGDGEVIEIYPGATLRAWRLPHYKSRPDEAVRLGVAACAAAGIALDVDPRLIERCCRYNSGGKSPDHDAADAFVALCTAILHAEGACRPALAREAAGLVAESEGVIWVPTIGRGHPLS